MRLLHRLLGASALLAALLPTPAHAIVNGKQVVNNDWSFMVAIGCSGQSTKPTCENRRYGQVPDGMYTPQFCAGTLIAPTVVVTAAHCLRHENGQVLDARDLVVGGGTPNLKAMTGTRVSTVLSVTEDPAYNPETQVHDLAIMRIAKALPDTSTIGWQPSADAALRNGGLDVEMAGWGDLLPVGTSPTIAQFAQLKLYAQDRCSAELGNRFNSELMLCATALNGTAWIDACQGDSGGPLTSTISGLRVLIGVISWGDSCATGKPGVYSSIPATLPSVLATVPAAAPTVRAGVKSLSVTVSGEAWMAGAWAVLAEHNLQLSTCGIVLTAVSTTGSCKVDNLVLGGNYVVRVVPPIGIVAPPPQLVNVKGAPDKPRIRSAAPISTKGYSLVSFQAPGPNDATVSVRSVTCRSTNSVRSARTSGLKLVVTNLRRGTTYSCTAQAINVYGVSTTSNRFTLR